MVNGVSNLGFKAAFLVATKKNDSENDLKLEQALEKYGKDKNVKKTPVDFSIRQFLTPPEEDSLHYRRLLAYSGKFGNDFETARSDVAHFNATTLITTNEDSDKNPLGLVKVILNKEYVMGEEKVYTASELAQRIKNDPSRLD